MSRRLEPRRDLEQERGFSDARLATDEDHRAGYNAAADDEVEFIESGFPSFGIRSADIAQSRRGRDASAFA